MTNEQNLVSLAKEGNAKAFEELVTLYEKKVYGMAVRYTGNEFDAMDICQEVFLRVYRFLPRFNEESQFSTWLYRITANVCKDFLRKTKLRMELPLETENEDEESYAMEISDLRYNPENQMERVEMRAAIGDAILNLSPKYREIIILRDISGLSYEEIGKSLSLEQGTVKSRIARARDKLRTFLSENGNIFTATQSKEY